MIRRVKISNFRGFSGKVYEFVIGRVSSRERGCVTSVVGPSASGKSSLVSALEFLQAVARGVRSADLLHGGELSAVSSDLSKPCDIVVVFSIARIVYQYGLRLECDVRARLWQIENEWLSVGRDDGSVLTPVFARTGMHVEVGGIQSGAGTYELDQKVFVLSTFVTPDAMHPLFRAKAYFANLFIFGDKIGFLDDHIPDQNRSAYLRPRAENLGAWLSFQMGNRVDFYRTLSEVLQRYLPLFSRLVVAHERASVSRLSALFLPSSISGSERTVPLWMISSTERAILLGAVMVAIGRVFRPADCLCDDFDLIEEACPKLASEIGHVFSTDGHLMAFHKRNRSLYQTVAVHLAKEGAGDASA